MVHPNFGIKKMKSTLEKACGKWFFLNITGNGTIPGYIKKVKGREVTLNPYKTIRYNAEHGCNLYELVSENAQLEISHNGYCLEPTNKETLEYIIKRQNEEILKELKKDKEHSKK